MWLWSLRTAKTNRKKVERVFLRVSSFIYKKNVSFFLEGLAWLVCLLKGARWKGFECGELVGTGLNEKERSKKCLLCHTAA